MAGRIALLEGRLQQALVSKPGQLYTRDTPLKLLEGQRFVSRGGYKLLTLIEAFKLDLSGLVCLDAGASTGGFCDCLLQHGAAKVYAVDVGHAQLHERLRADPRIVSLEGVNLRYAGPELIPEPVDLLTCDLSFISLTLVLPVCMAWLKANGRAAILIKPQFELGPGETVKGIVRSEEARQRAVRKVLDFAKDSLGLECLGLVPSQIKGTKGNQEYLALLQREAQPGC